MLKLNPSIGIDQNASLAQSMEYSERCYLMSDQICCVHLFFDEKVPSLKVKFANIREYLGLFLAWLYILHLPHLKQHSVVEQVENSVFFKKF